MKTFEIYTPTFSKLIKALDKESAEMIFKEMFKHAEILDIQESDYYND